MADALLLLTVSIWGVNFSVVKAALVELPPLAFNAVRFAAAALTLVIVFRASGGRWRFERRHLASLIGLGLLGNTTYQLLFLFGQAVTTADNGALILATVPAWVALGGTAVGLERVRAAGWLGIGLSLAGIVLIIAGSDRAAEFRFGGATLGGDLLILLSTFCWSGYTLLSRLVMRHYSALAVTSFSTTAGAVPLVLLGLPTLARLEGPVAPGAWAAAVFSGVFAIALSYIFWNHGVSQLGSARTSLYSYLTPPIALLTAWLALGETLTAAQVGGAALVLAGVVLARRHTAPLRPRDADTGHKP